MHSKVQKLEPASDDGGIPDDEMMQVDLANPLYISASIAAAQSASALQSAPQTPSLTTEKVPNARYVEKQVYVSADKLTPNDQILFAFGDCIMKGATKLKTYSSAYRYLVTKLRSLGHKVVFYPERFTSQRFPITGTQMEFSGSNQVFYIFL